MEDWEAQVPLAQRGDVAAFDQIVRRFQHMAVGYAYSILGDFQLAEDAAQEAFIQAYRDLGALQVPQAFPSWLRRIVLGQCDRLTRRKRLPAIALDEAAVVADPGPGPLEELQRRETQDALLRALNALPQGERAATALFYIDGYSMAEVGEFLDVPVSTVKSRLHAARGRLHSRMEGLVEQTIKSHAPGEEFSRRVRKVLEGVPPISFRPEPGKRPESFAFPACLRACMQAMGEDPAYDYMYHMGTSGAAFGLVWHTERWHYTGDLSDLAVTTDWHEPILRAFRAIGYGCEIVAREGSDEEYYRARIMASIHKGRPVLASGVVGPPACSIITGYDERGDVLTGWSLFQGYPGHDPATEFEPSGYFRKRGWFKDTGNLIVVGRKGAAPEPAQVHREALQWALEVQRVPLVRDRHSGQTAYAAWAEDLLRDDDFAGDLEVLFERLDCHLGAMSLAEGRWYAAQFLRRIAAHEPAMAGELELAAACCDAETGLIVKVADLQGGWDPHDEQTARRLAEGSVRREMARLILQASEQDVQGGRHIQRALAATVRAARE